ncbi:MAG TPA: TonB family protein [Chitinophagaceae bacterium]|nr:TonB family protein [Chitinophagaceae bacterium]
MSENNNIKNYTAADIEKYWNGRLNAAEMHAMEKAAMDDPFLAEALEGYREASASATGLALLKEKINRRTGAAVITLKRKKYTWLKVAAAITIIAGAGLIVQQLVSSNTDNTIALEKSDEDKSQAPANNVPVNPDSQNNVMSALKDTLTAKAEQKTIYKTNEVSAPTHAFKQTDTIKSDHRPATEAKNETEDLAAVSAPVSANARNKEGSEKAKALRSSFDSSGELKDNNARLAKPNAAFYESDKSAGIYLSNKYNYRVVDGQNNPVPFANVMNSRDNIGTYTDVNGRFTLVSSDSVLNVQIKSLGYISDNYKLTPTTKQSGDLVLKEDDVTRTQILAQNRKVVSSLSRKDTTEVEEPEVGWGYYNTYVANNIQIPENIRAKNSSRDVELSFDIDKTGHPINIKVTKSSQCKECDDEAIRLIKEGPRWKKKGKKSRTRISIAVDQQ